MKQSLFLLNSAVTPQFEQAMEDVLNTSRYNRLTGRSVDFRQMIIDAVNRFITFISSRFSINLPDWSSYNTRVISYLFAGLGIIIALVSIGAILYIITKRRKKVIIASDLADILKGIENKEYTLDEILALSNTCLQNNELREAIRYRYIAVLIYLNGLNIIRIVAYKTNYQIHKDLLTLKPKTAKHFKAIADLYHYTWFGGKLVDNETIGSYIADTEILLASNNESHMVQL